MNERIVRREDLSRQASDWRNANAGDSGSGKPRGRMSFEEVEREYYLGIEDVLEETARRVRLLSRIGKKPKSQSVIGSNED